MESLWHDIEISMKQQWNTIENNIQSNMEIALKTQWNSIADNIESSI